MEGADRRSQLVPGAEKGAEEPPTPGGREQKKANESECEGFFAELLLNPVFDPLSNGSTG